MTTSYVLVVGGYVQDHVWQVDAFPQPGETCRALGFSTGPGGKGFNQAVACVRQGVATHFIGAIGNDLLASNAETFAENEKLCAVWLKHPQQPTAAASIMVNKHGENSIAVSLGANNFLSSDFLTSQVHAFEKAGLVLCQLENNLDAVYTALSFAQRYGTLSILNPAPVHPDISLELLQMAKILTPNETEFALLCQRFTGANISADHIASTDDAALHDLCRQLTRHTVVITLGRAGCFISHGDDLRGDTSQHYRLPAESVKAIDTTGAGDAFNGGLAAATQLYPGQAFVDQAAYAGRVAALSTEHLGAALAMPSKTQVLARFS
jgi:ribokinase